MTTQELITALISKKSRDNRDLLDEAADMLALQEQTIKELSKTHAHWEWIDVPYDGKRCVCSHCKEELVKVAMRSIADANVYEEHYIEETVFCPNCGAKMDEPQCPCNKASFDGYCYNAEGCKFKKKNDEEEEYEEKDEG